MKTIYRLMGAALCVCGAAACSSDSAPATTAPPAATEAPSAAADVPASSTPTPGAVSALSAEQPANAAPAPSAAAPAAPPKAAASVAQTARSARQSGAAAPVVQAADRPTKRGAIAAAPRPTARQWRPLPAPAPTTPRPNSLANATPSAPAGGREAAPEPLADDAAGYLASVTAPAQVFWVRPGRDTVLAGAQGTLVAVPATAWAVPAGSAPVRLEIREFYATPDIIMAGLSTRSGPNRLETGGMVKLDASLNGQPVGLRPGQRLLLRLPTQRKLEGMQLFQGISADGQPAVDWQLPAADPADEAAIARQKSGKDFELNKGGHWPALPGGNKFLLKFFDKQIPGDKTTLARLRRRRPATVEEKQLLKEYSKANHKKVLAVTRVLLNVDSTGAAQTSVLPGGDAEIDATVLATAGKLPRWRPAKFRRLAAPHRTEKVNAVGVLSVLYTSAGKRLIGVQWDEEATHIPRLQRYYYARQAEARKLGQQRFAAQFASAGPLTLNENLYYELEAGGLGWINCDRFLEEQGPQVQFAVQTAQPQTVVTLVFQQQRSILASTRTEAQAAIFDGVPAGAAATVVALRREKGVTLLATAPVTLGQATPPTLDFRPVSLEELRSTLAKL